MQTEKGEMDMIYRTLSKEQLETFAQTKQPLWGFAYEWEEEKHKAKRHLLPIRGCIRNVRKDRYVFQPFGRRNTPTGVSSNAAFRSYADTYLEACEGYLAAKGSHPEPGSKANWVPTIGRIFPDDGVIVQVTYRSLVNGELRCDRFAYREDDTWKWEFDRTAVLLDILAWKDMGKSYEPQAGLELPEEE